MYTVIFVTAANKEEAKRISQVLLKKKLIACANIVDKVESFFWWKGKIDSGKEVLIIMKSKKALLVQIIKAVKGVHSYKVPEVIAMPIAGGNKDYLRWIDESLR